jgi:hypothetical protein
MNLLKNFESMPVEGNPNHQIFQIMKNMAKKIEDLEDRIDNLEFKK